MLKKLLSTVLVLGIMLSVVFAPSMTSYSVAVAEVSQEEYEIYQRLLQENLDIAGITPQEYVGNRRSISFLSGQTELKVDTSASVLTGSIPSGATVSWSVGDPAIAVINNSGTVTGINAGITSVTVTVTSSSGTTETASGLVIVWLEDGVYRFKSKYSNKYMSAMSITDYSIPEQQTITSTSPDDLLQMWKVKYLGSGAYSFRPYGKLDMCLAHSGTTVNVHYTDKADTILLANENAIWTIMYNSVRYGYRIYDSIKDKVLSLSVDSSNSGVEIANLTDTGSDGKRWALEKIASPAVGGYLYSGYDRYVIPGGTTTLAKYVGLYAPTAVGTQITWSSSNSSIASVSSAGVVTGKAIGSVTITARSTQNSSAVCSIPVNVVEVDNGTYYIQNKENEKLIGLNSSSPTSDTSVKQLDYEDTNRLWWVFEPQTNNTYKIKSVYSGKYLSVASTSNGASVVQYTASSANAQSWRVTRTESGSLKLSAYNASTSYGIKTSSNNSLINGAATDNSQYDEEWNVIVVPSTINIEDTLTSVLINVFGFSSTTAVRIRTFINRIDANVSYASEIERSWIIVRVLGGLCYQDNENERQQWNNVAGTVIDSNQTWDIYYKNVLGYTDAEYSELLGDIVSQHTDENTPDFAHCMISASSRLAYTLDLMSGLKEEILPLMASQFAGWLGDTVILGSNGQPSVGNDDYCADLDAENIYRLLYRGYTFEEAVSYYYSHLTQYRNRAFEFKRHVSWDYAAGRYILAMLLYNQIDVTQNQGVQNYPDAYNFYCSLRDGLANIGDYI